MNVSTEERLAALEREMSELKAKLEPAPAPMMGKTRPDFLDSMVGIHANSPLFEEVVQSIEAEREQERIEAQQLAMKDLQAA